MTPLVSFEQFRKIMSLHPFHAWGLADSTIVPLGSACNDLVLQYAWQGNGAVGRADVLNALEYAEGRLRDWLGYSIAPHYVTDTLRFPKYADVQQRRMGYNDAAGQWLSVNLLEGHLRAVGVERLALLGTVTTYPGDGLVYSDEDGDGLDDTFTITLATGLTDPAQIGVYFAAGDRLGEAAGEAWKIQPVKVSISGGVATLSGRAWLLVVPALYRAVNLAAIDPTDASHFVTALDLYQHSCDPTGTTLDTCQAKLIWETEPWPSWAYWGTSFAGSGTANTGDPAGEAYAIGRAALRDQRRGIIGLGEAFFVNGQWVQPIPSLSYYRPPDRAQVRYLAGAPLGPEGQIDQQYQITVARFAAAELGRRLCPCDSALQEVYHWQIDLAFAGQSERERFNLSAANLDNPFGTKRGQVAAWKFVQQRRQLRGIG